MEHKIIDPKAVIAAVAAESALQTKINALSGCLETVIKSHYRNQITLLMKDGRILEGAIRLSTPTLMVFAIDGQKEWVRLNVSDIADCAI